MEGKSINIYRQMAGLLRLARRAYAPFKAEIFWLTFLGFVGGLLEGIGINAVIPLLTSVLGIHDAALDTFSELIRNFFVFLHIPFVPRYMLAFIVVLFIGKAIVSFWVGYIQLVITAEYERVTRSRLFNMVMKASWPYLLRQSLGNLETALMVDIPKGSSLLSKISFTITLATSLVIYLIVAFSISPPVMISTAFLGILTFIVLRPLMDRVHGQSRIRAVLNRDTMHHVTEHVGGLKSVKAYGVETESIQRGDTFFKDIRLMTTRIGFSQQLATQAVAPIGVLYIAGIIALAFKTPFISFPAIPAILYLI